MTNDAAVYALVDAGLHGSLRSGLPHDVADALLHGPNDVDVHHAKA